MKTTGVGTARARVAIAGNPSDGYGGAVLATVAPLLGASVAVERFDRMTIAGPSEDATPLITSILGQLAIDQPLRITWRTDIPRSVGLGGSSAIVIATMRAAMDLFRIKVEDGPRQALQAELDLGIAAGLQDRIAQWHDHLVLMDFSTDSPAVRHIQASGFGAFVAWCDAPEASTRVHSDLRRRFDRGDADVVSGMHELAELAEQAANALQAEDEAGLREAMAGSLAVRERIVDMHVSHIALARAATELCGGVNSTGSGGAVVGLLPPGGIAEVEDWAADTGYAVLRTSLGGI